MNIIITFIFVFLLFKKIFGRLGKIENSINQLFEQELKNKMLHLDQAAYNFNYNEQSKQYLITSIFNSRQITNSFIHTRQFSINLSAIRTKLIADKYRIIFNHQICAIILIQL